MTPTVIMKFGGSCLVDRSAFKKILKILEIYKGEKYSDTALTEVYFQGIDVY